MVKPTHPHFKLSTEEGVSYICYEDDPLHILYTEMEAYAEKERILPLRLIMHPDIQVEPHTKERARLVDQILRYGEKLNPEVLLALTSRLRRLVLADWFARRLYEINSGNERAPGTSQGTGDGNKPVLKDEANR